MTNTAVGLIGFVIYVLQLLIWLVIIQAILSWLIAFNVVNTSNRFVDAIATGLDRLTAPLLRPIRRLLPDMGGIDFSPLLLILGLILLQRLLEGVARDIMLA
jgi:YggT family protein